MRVGYALLTDDGLVNHDAYQEAVATIRGTWEEIWLTIDGAALMRLPSTFNRCVSSGRSKINTAVLKHSEIENENNAFPLPDEAPMLIFDFDHRRVDWLPQGIGRRAITLHQEEGG